MEKTFGDAKDWGKPVAGDAKDWPEKVVGDAKDWGKSVVMLKIGESLW